MKLMRCIFFTPKSSGLSLVTLIWYFLTLTQNPVSTPKQLTIQLVSASTLDFKKPMFSLQRTLLFFGTFSLSLKWGSWSLNTHSGCAATSEKGIKHCKPSHSTTVGIKIKDSISRRNHIYLAVTSRSENNALYFIQHQPLLISFAKYF